MSTRTHLYDEEFLDDQNEELHPGGDWQFGICIFK